MVKVDFFCIQGRDLFGAIVNVVVSDLKNCRRNSFVFIQQPLDRISSQVTKDPDKDATTFPLRFVGVHPKESTGEGGSTVEEGRRGR